MWYWLRFTLVTTWDWPRVSGKLASLRSRIRGGLAICEVDMLTAAQFLTLRLVISIATEAICVDLDGPGHAPPYLCVSDDIMIVAQRILFYLSLVLSGYALIVSGVERKGRHIVQRASASEIIVLVGIALLLIVASMVVKYRCKAHGM